MDLRNRIAGGIAIALGAAVLAILLAEGRWDSHGTERPISSLLGALTFIGLGAWYLFKGKKAEPWALHRGEKVLRLETKRPGPDIKAISETLEHDPAFQRVCRTEEKKWRQIALQMEQEIGNKPTEPAK
ncbi:hypothetical protein [Azonexus sp.]|jgi:hypothetical protein|uniref:hypothetical protein n=1 Tax=Azonexus sp. TaxID=1872668 RepID=UPI00283A7BD9|nr:hypothetical protein [Azonexus sp.]MDR1996461.1 hypothetical protein [Azonexus sp.]